MWCFFIALLFASNLKALVTKAFLLPDAEISVRFANHHEVDELK
jgi:hypothetical protein